ncbi:MAG: hypothetical protein IRY87_37200, partial [Acetobacteraceae bacterium]|nr:hypothetical protein [Acetobacteraceae bacterium]
MELDVLIRGQSNAFLFLTQGQENMDGTPKGVTLLQSEVQHLLGFDGVNDQVHLDYDWWTTGAETIYSGTAFIGDWMQQTTNGWQPLEHEQALLNHIRLNPHPAATSSAILWFHSETDSTNANLTADQWMSAVRTDAALVRQAMGRDAVSAPYLFVSAIPFSGANDATTQAIRLGMEQLAADPAFNAAIAARALDLDMSFSFPGESPTPDYGRFHMSAEDAALIAERVARSLANEWAAYAKPGSPLALAGGHIDSAGPQVVAANLVAPDTLRLTVQQDHSAGFAPLSAAAAAGIGWSVRSGDASVSADHVDILGPNTLQVHFSGTVPAGGLLFYGYGYGRLAQYNQPGEGNAIYDADGLPIWTAAQGVPVTDGTVITGTPGDDRLAAG